MKIILSILLGDAIVNAIYEDINYQYTSNNTYDVHCTSNDASNMLYAMPIIIYFFLLLYTFHNIL